MKQEPERDELTGRVRLPKLNGADTEVGNLVQGLETGRTDTCREASRALLQEFTGLPRVSRRHAMNCRCERCRSDDDHDESRDDASWGGWGNGSSGWGNDSARSNHVRHDPQDFGRKFLPQNGSCVYIDLDHLELALPEVLSARDHVAATHAMLRLLRRAMNAANAKLPEGQRLVVLANNSDGLGNSYGGHLNVLVSRRCWDDVMNRKPHYLGYLSSYQASSIVITGQGKVGSENDRPAVDFQLSQRADFFETLIGPQTTYRRPLVNSRDETLCGRRGFLSARDDDPARLHCIFYDTNLSHVALFLKVGVMQLILALLEAGQVNPRLCLDDPLEAVWSWSSDPSLQAKATLADRSRLTAVEMQQHFLEEARGFHAKGGFLKIVPDAGEILELWESTLRLLASRDMPALAQRLDWALKLSLLEQALESHPQLRWTSPALRHLDLLYSSLDEEEGLYWIHERAGLTERIVDDERVDYFTTQPPENTRAWTRAMLLRRGGEEHIDDVDWNRIRFRSGSSWDRRYRRLEMPAPLGQTRQETASVFDQARSLDELIDLLGGDAPTVTWGNFNTSSWSA